ncbi:MAG: hypothetical protein MJZ27_10375 [Bacteroidales bacterium]|nr:hypothetical protein [Bacteroidales bacterium]
MTTKQHLVRMIVSEMTISLMRDKNITIQQALKTIYHSKIFQAIDDERTGLYTQSPLLAYSYLKREIN